MSTFKKAQITIAGKLRTILLVNYKNDDTTTESKTVDRMHHIHILDRSYSMSGSIVALMEDVKKTFRAIPVGDYISVVWFSSEGQNGVVIKGYKKTDDDFAGVDNLIDSIKHCVGCTCFHEPLELVKSIIEEMKPLCPYYNVTLFTDGCSCCNVSSSEDYKMSYDVVSSFKNEIMALNTLGYGYYYDKEFLTKIAEITDFGKYLHSSNVKEYSEIFKHNYERVRDMVAEKVEISAPDCEILYLNSKSTKLANNIMNLSSIEKRKKQFAIIYPEDGINGIDYSVVKINDELIDLNKIKFGKLPDTTTANLLYALAYENYYKGNREVCLDILKDLRDKHLIDAQLNAFTIDESSKFLKELNKCIFSNSTRYQSGKAPVNYLPANDAFCIMDLLGILCEEGNYYIPDMSSYKRIGLQVEDTFNLFTPKRDYDIFAPFNDNIVYNKNKLNISIKFTRDGVVAINPKRAKQVGLPESIDSRQFQTHTIIKDGHLNMEKIKVKLSTETGLKLMRLQIDVLDSSSYFLTCSSQDDKDIFEIDLTKLPVINRNYLNDSTIDKVFETIVAITEDEVFQKVVNWMVSNHPYKEYKTDSFGRPPVYNAEQVEVLKEHGLNEFLTYAGVNRKVTEKNEDDYYEARELEFMLKGCSSIPAIEKGIDTYNAAISKGKEPNFMSKCIVRSIDAINDGIQSLGINKGTKEEREFLDKCLKTTKAKLNANRNTLSAIKMAKVLTSSWWEGLTIDGDKYTYTSSNGDSTLVIKTGYDKVFFN